MKNKIPFFLVFSACTIVSGKSTPDNYLNRFLPEDSLIRKRCNEETYDKSSKCEACNYLNTIIESLDGDKQKPVNRDIVDLQDVIAMFAIMASPHAIREILSDQTDEVQESEYWNVRRAAFAAKAVREERWRKQEEEHTKIHPAF